jgi:hypothetical protein
MKQLDLSDESSALLPSCTYARALKQLYILYGGA